MIVPVPQPPTSPAVDDEAKSASSSGASGVATPSSSAPDEEQHPFRDARISFAVDTSGSTTGRILAAEQAFVKSIAQHLSPQSRLQGRLLPWNSSASRVQSLAYVDALTAGGGTVPSVLLDDPHHRRTLAQSSLWFLMTDGLIHQRDRAQFAMKLARAGVHGVSCVVVVTGDPGPSGNGLGPAGNISVGVSVFAIVPDCAFLFQNVRNGELRLLQAKGAFRCLLKGQGPPPTFHGNADLSTFPRVTPSDFSDIVLPKPRRLDPGQIALQGQQVVNMDDLFANRLRQEEVSRILANEDNVASLIMTAQSRNQPQMFQTWIQQQQLQPMNHTTAPRQNVDVATETAFRELLQAQQQGQQLQHAERVQAQVQEAHSKNMQQFAQQFRQKMHLAQQRDMLIQQANARAGTSIDNASSLAPTSAYKPVVPPPQLNHHTMGVQPGQAEPKLQDFLHTPGFRRATGSFRGSCPICQGQNMTMSMLLRRASGTSPTTAEHRDNQSESSPAPGSSLSSDVLSSTICCDPCSNLCVKLAMSTDSMEKIIAAWPLVRLAENRAAFQKALSVAFEGRQASGSIPDVFLPAILNALCRQNNSSAFKEALRWASVDLLRSVPTVSSAAKPDQSRLPSSVADTMKRALAVFEESFLLECPIDAFLMILRGAGLLGQ